LHRTGALLRSLKTSYKSSSVGGTVTLGSNKDYAWLHQEGGMSEGYKKLGRHNVQAGASGAVVGGYIFARPFMTPSRRVLNSPKRLLGAKMRSYGW